MARLPLYSPTDLSIITDCTLKYSFFQQTDQVSENRSTNIDPLEIVVLKTIRYLHASGGPFRLNLPSTLRVLGQYVSEMAVDNPHLYMSARQTVATYHRHLKSAWANVMASNELMSLTIRLFRTAIQVETVFDRVDKSDDGGIIGVKFFTAPDAIPHQIPNSDIEATILHALVAAAYPGRRPVRLKYYWLYHNQWKTIELTEKQFRQNLVKMKERVQAWQEGRNSGSSRSVL